MDNRQDGTLKSEQGFLLVPAIRRANEWTTHEDAILKSEYHKGIDFCLSLLARRTRCAIQQRATKYGLKVDTDRPHRTNRPRDIGKSLVHIPDNAQEGVHKDGYVVARLVALLTKQMEEQSKRWGFPVGHMKGQFPLRATYTKRERDDAP